MGRRNTNPVNRIAAFFMNDRLNGIRKRRLQYTGVDRSEDKAIHAVIDGNCPAMERIMYLAEIPRTESAGNKDGEIGRRNIHDRPAGFKHVHVVPF